MPNLTDNYNSYYEFQMHLLMQPITIITSVV